MQTVFVNICFNQIHDITVGAGQDSDGIGEFQEQKAAVSAFADQNCIRIAQYLCISTDSPFDLYKISCGIFWSFSASAVVKQGRNETNFLDGLTLSVLKGGSAGNTEKVII